MDAISIIILTRDRLEKLERCLAAIEPQLTGDDEVILVDTGSADGTRERFASSLPPRLKFFTLDSPGDWAEARNYGAEHAANPFIAFLDDDCYAAPDWVERGRAGLADCDAVGGIAEPVSPVRWPGWWANEMGWLVGYSVPGHFGPEAGRYYYPFTANLWARATLLNAEGFQELGAKAGQRAQGSFSTGREDAEWWRRVRVRGYRTQFDSDLRVSHDIDIERINIDYMLTRARRDGADWARREGTADDLEPLAYQWWRHATVHDDAEDPALPTAARAALHRFDRARASAALRELAKKIAAEPPRGDSATLTRVRAMTAAGFQLFKDRSKTIARRIALAFSPPREWPPFERPPKRIVIAAFGRLGDMVILQSALRGLIAAQPDLSISVLAPEASATVLGELERIELTPLPDSAGSLAERRRFLTEWLREKNPEVVFAPYLHGGWGPALARVRRPIAPVATFRSDEGLTRQIDRERIALKIEKFFHLHEGQNLARLFGLADLKCEPERPCLKPSPAALASAREQFAALDEKGAVLSRLFINPSAGEPNREWTDEAWAGLMALLCAPSDRSPLRFIVDLFQPRPELERFVAERPELTGRVHWLRSAPLDLVFATISICEGVITVDSAPQHLAHALGVPSLTLFGPQDERRWADPFGRRIHQTIRGGCFDLTPEELRGLPRNHIMRLITSEAAEERAREWLAEIRAESRPSS